MAPGIPAKRLDKALAEIRGLAVGVEAEVSTSKDVTDESVDLSSGLRNLHVAEQALVRLFERADKVEDALKVQSEPSTVQGEIEKVQGRLNFLRETSTFSLINMTAKLEPGALPVDGGAHRRVIDFVWVFVSETPGWIAGDWNLGATAKSATRAVSRAAAVCMSASGRRFWVPCCWP